MTSLDEVPVNAYSNHQLVTEYRFDESIADESLVFHMRLYAYTS